MTHPGDMPKARTIPALLAEQAARYGEYDALIGDSRRYNYTQLWSDVRAFSKALMAMGIRRGDHVAILMGNKVEWIVADLAICSIGAVMVSVNTYVTGPELAYILRHSDAKLLIHADSFLKYDYIEILSSIEPLAKSAPMLTQFIHVGARGRDGSVSFADAMRRGAQTSESALNEMIAAVTPTDVAYLLYTSGSTSTPKGVQLLHHPLIENMWHLGNRMHSVPGDRFWAAVSMFWALGCENILFNALTHAGAVVLQEFFEPGEALRLISKERCTVYHGSPNMAGAMLEHPDRAKYDLSSLRSGACVGTPEQIRRVVELGATEICNVYGLTETYGNTNLTDGRLDPRDKAHSTVGRAVEGVEQRIVHPETLAPCQPGEIGEIQVRGRVTIGYYKDQDKNAAAFTEDGFFRTGDLGLLDEDGFLHFKGRLKELIKSGGISVSPAEVEEALMAHPGVEIAYVVPVPDPVKTEIVGALIVARASVDVQVLENELRTEMKKQLASYKVPRVYHFMAEADLPRTSTGKVSRAGIAGNFTQQR
ncbi:MAG: acyl--CoA ligase [Pseudolabrys sp.]|nr:acyl--CoA ligase [Pseudolabrys sp.]